MIIFKQPILSSNLQITVKHIKEVVLLINIFNDFCLTNVDTFLAPDGTNNSFQSQCHGITSHQSSTFTRIRGRKQGGPVACALGKAIY
jgi:hypothetical protein